MLENVRAAFSTSGPEEIEGPDEDNARPSCCQEPYGGTKALAASSFRPRNNTQALLWSEKGSENLGSASAALFLSWASQLCL